MSQLHDVYGEYLLFPFTLAIRSSRSPPGLVYSPPLSFLTRRAPRRKAFRRTTPAPGLQLENFEEAVLAIVSCESTESKKEAYLLTGPIILNHSCPLSSLQACRRGITYKKAKRTIIWITFIFIPRVSSLVLSS